MSTFFLRSWFHVSQAWQAACAAAGPLTMAAFAEAGEVRGTKVAQGRSVQVWRTPVEVADRAEVLYIKCYHYGDRAFRYWARGSRAWREARNYLAFARLGIPGPELVAVGEERTRYGLRRALIVTREIPDARDLEQIVGTHEFRADAALRRHILDQAARFAGRAHGRGFFHRDLKLRNLLVHGFPSPDCRVLWIDCPLGGFYWLGRWHLARADLEDMGKSLRQVVSAEEWSSFRQAYRAARRGAAATAGV
jgi:tRNA A-37 threonylcarbamoyl transferase component Bud32